MNLNPLTDIEVYRSFGIRLMEALVRAYHSPVLGKGALEPREDSRALETAWKKTLPAFFDFEGRIFKITTDLTDSRKWCDLTLSCDELVFHYNFKAGDPNGHSKDNIGGLCWLRHLILNKSGGTFRKILAEDIADLRTGRRAYDLTTRDYFILYYLGGGESKIIPVGAIRPQDIVSNPSNLLQADFRTAQTVARTQKETIDFLIDLYIDYAIKLAIPANILQAAGITPKFARQSQPSDHRKGRVVRRKRLRSRVLRPTFAPARARAAA